VGEVLGKQVLRRQMVLDPKCDQQQALILVGLKLLVMQLEFNKMEITETESGEGGEMELSWYHMCDI
jgi:hypothetical protein